MMIEQFCREGYKNYKSQTSCRTVRWGRKEIPQKKNPNTNPVTFFIGLRMTSQFEGFPQLSKSDDNASVLQLIIKDFPFI